MFRSLEAGVYDGKYEVINVQGSALPNIFSQVAAFADRNTSTTIRFTNEYDMFIELDTVNKKVTAHFEKGNNPLTYLPTNYRSYDIFYGSYAINTAADVDTITTWTEATEIHITYYCRIRNKEFMKRQMELSHLLKNVDFSYPIVLF